MSLFSYRVITTGRVEWAVFPGTLIMRNIWGFLPDWALSPSHLIILGHAGPPRHCTQTGIMWNVSQTCIRTCTRASVNPHTQTHIWNLHWSYMIIMIWHYTCHLGFSLHEIKTALWQTHWYDELEGDGGVGRALWSIVGFFLLTWLWLKRVLFDFWHGLLLCRVLESPPFGSAFGT